MYVNKRLEEQEMHNSRPVNIPGTAALRVTDNETQEEHKQYRPAAGKLQFQWMTYTRRGTCYDTQPTSGFALQVAGSIIHFGAGTQPANGTGATEALQVRNLSQRALSNTKVTTLSNMTRIHTDKPMKPITYRAKAHACATVGAKRDRVDTQGIKAGTFDNLADIVTEDIGADTTGRNLDIVGLHNQY